MGCKHFTRQFSHKKRTLTCSWPIFLLHLLMTYDVTEVSSAYKMASAKSLLSTAVIWSVDIDDRLDIITATKYF